MWEAIVEKLLSKYLSEYVEGIEREKLQVGVLRGDLELCDLTIKPGSFDEKNLGMSVLHGRIGRLSIGISWKKWMAQDYDLRVKVEHMHVLLKSYVPETPLSVEGLRRELRLAKESKVLKREKMFLDIMRRPELRPLEAKDGTFLMNVTSRVIRNIEVEVTDVHLTFHDATRKLTLGCLLDSGSLLSSPSPHGQFQDLYNSTQKKTDQNSMDFSKTVNKRIEFRGFSIYIGVSRLPKWKKIVKAYEERDKQSLHQLVPQLLTSIKASLQGHPMSPEPSSEEPHPEDQEAFSEFYQAPGDLSFDYVLFPLNIFFDFFATQSHKRLSAFLTGGSRGLSLHISHLKMLIEFFQEASCYRRYCHRVLTRHGRSMNLHYKNIEETRKLFTILYTKQLHYEAGLLGPENALSEANLEKLQFLHDIVGVRHLAKWRASCLIKFEELVEAKRNLVEKELARARKEQSWWRWATQGSDGLENVVLEKVQKEEPALTIDEAKFVSDAVVTEMEYDLVHGPSFYEFSVNLPRFYISIFDKDMNWPFVRLDDSGVPLPKTELPFLKLTLGHLQARAFVNSCIDRDDKDAYAWRWNFLMSKVVLWYRDSVIVTVNGFSDSLKDTIFFTESTTSHNEKSQNAQVTSFLDTVTKDSQEKDLYVSDLRDDDDDWPKNQSTSVSGSRQTMPRIATLWDIERVVSQVEGEYHILVIMAPLKIFLTRHFITDFTFFLVFLFGGQSKDSSEDHPAFSNNDFSEQMKEEVFYDGVMENYERFFLAVKEKTQDLIKIHMVLCAPIVHYKISETCGALVHFGELRVTSGPACMLRHITLNFRLSDAQVACWYEGNDCPIPVIRPIPVELSISYYPTTSTMTIDVLFHELFIEINISAFEILLKIVAFILSCLSLKHLAECLFFDTRKDQKGFEYLDHHLYSPQSMAELSTVDKHLGSCSSNDDGEDELLTSSLDDLLSACSENSDGGLFQSFMCTITLFICRVGFSLFNNDSTEVLRGGAIDMSILAKVATQQHQSPKIDAEMMLHTIFASDPSTRTPLVLTLQNDHVNLSDHELFEETYQRQNSSRFASYVNEFHGEHSQLQDPQVEEEDDLSENDDKVSLDFFDHALSTLKIPDLWENSDGKNNDFNTVKDSAEKRSQQLRDTEIKSFVVHYVSLPFSLLNIHVNASCEMNWNKGSVQCILLTLQKFRTQGGTFLKDQIEKLQSERDKFNTRMFRSFHRSHINRLNALESSLDVLRALFMNESSPPLEPAVDRTLDISSDKAKRRVLSHNVDCLGHEGTLPEFRKVETRQTSFQCRVALRTTTFNFWLNNEKFSQGSLNEINLEYTGYTTCDAQLDISVQRVDFFFKQERIITSTDISQLVKGTSQLKASCTGSQETSTVAPLQARIRFYHNPLTGHDAHDVVPYNSCISLRVSRLVYIYFQRDLIELYNYLCDGVIDVILRKSYEVAYQFVKSSCVLFGLYVTKAVVVVSEDKSCIPQSPFYVKKKTYPVGAMARVGSFISFSIPSVSIRNGYICRSSCSGESVDEAAKDIVSKVQIDVDGISASMVHCDTYNAFSEHISGQVLDGVVGGAQLVSGNPFLIDFFTSHVYLSLNQEQLTLLLDILNENLAGLGYNPASIQLDDKSRTPQSIDFPLLNHFDSLLQQTCTNPDELLEENLRRLFAIPPSRYSVRGRIHSIDFTIGFAPNAPLARLNTQNISVSCDVSLYGLYATYRFMLLAEYLVVEDIRPSAKNSYKRFLECLPDSSPSTYRQKQMDSIKVSVIPNPSVYTYYFNDGQFRDLPGTEPVWMRSGIDLKPRVCGPFDNFSQDERESDEKFYESISFSFVNNLVTTTFSATLWNPTVYVYTVGMQDLLDFVVASFSFSTMRQYPKPVPCVVTSKLKRADDKTFKSLLHKRLKSILPQTRPFIINVVIHQGVFNLFSCLDCPYKPIIQLKGHFEFKAESVENYLLFKAINLFDCVLSVVEISPTEPSLNKKAPPETSTFHDVMNMGGSTLSPPSPSVLTKTLIQKHSSVIISKTFSFKASGLLETLYDAVIKRWFPPLCRSELSQNYRNIVSHDNLEKSYKASPEAHISSLRIDVEISECVLHVSVKALATICSALACLNQDLPFMSPKTPYPPIVAVDSFLESASSPVVPTARSRSETTEEKPCNIKSKFISLHRYSSIGLAFKGIRIVLFNNARTTPTPIMKVLGEIGMLNLINSPLKSCVTACDMSLVADYMGQRAGEWQPFIEESNVTWSFVSYNSSNDPELEIRKCESQFSHTRNSIKSDLPSNALFESSDLDKNEQKRLCQEWGNLAPDRCLNILFTKPLVVNIVPDIFQLLNWIVSLLDQPLKPKHPTNVSEDFIDESSREPFETWPSFSTEGKGRNKQLIMKRLEGLTESQPVTETTYHYLNLTGERFTAFTIQNSTPNGVNPRFEKKKSLDTSEPVDQTASDSDESLSTLSLQSVQQLEPTTAISSLDQLAFGHYATQFLYQNISADSFYIFLTCNAPKTIVQRLTKQFPHIPESDIIRSLLTTRSERATMNSFLNIQQFHSMNHLSKSDSDLRTLLHMSNPAPPYLGEFPRRMPVVPIILSRSGRHLVPIDYESINENSVTSVEGEETHLSKYPSTIHSTPKDKYIPNRPTAVARVFSHHLSCKLLMLTTHVLIENHTGFPLQIAFLQSGLEPLGLSRPELYCAPCSILRGDIHEERDEKSTTSTSSASTNQKRCLQYPELNDAVNFKRLYDYNCRESSYALCLPDDYFVSVPPSAFFKGNRVIMTCRPASLEPSIQKHSALSSFHQDGGEKSHFVENQNDKLSITPDNGWCCVYNIDCDESSTTSSKLSVRSCRIPVKQSLSQPASVFNKTKLSRHFLKQAATLPNEATTELHLTIVRMEDNSPFSKDAPLFVYKIFPAFILINACPTSLDVLFSLHTPTYKARHAVPELGVQSNSLHPPGQKTTLGLSISPLTIFYLYSLSPSISKCSLRMQLRFLEIAESQWSNSIKFSNTPMKDSVLSRLFVDCGTFAPVEVEVYKQLNLFMDSIPMLSTHQRGCLVSLPRWFIDRTDLNIRVMDSTSPNMKPFPVTQKICFLGNSDHPEVQLTVWKSLNREGTKSSEFSFKRPSSTLAEIPAVGEFSNAFLQTDTFYYILCLQTSQVNPRDIFGVSARCISLVPKYVFTNTFEDESVWTRQVFPGSLSNHINPVTECGPKQSIFLYWTEAKNPLLFQFKVGGHHQWSGPIFATDEFVGGYDIAVMKEHESAFTIFHIQIISDNGVISIVLRSISDSQRTPLHSVILRNRLNNISIWFRTFHEEKTSPNIRSLNCSDFACFQAAPQSEILVAWPLPFTFKQFMCGLELFDEHFHSLRSSSVFKIHPYTAYHRRCLEIKGLALSYRVFIAIGCRGNTISIDLLAETLVPSLDLSMNFHQPNEQESNPTCSSLPTSLCTVRCLPETEPLKSLQAIVYFSKICLSCVSAGLCQELLYTEISSMCGCLLQKKESQLIEFVLSSFQTDSQLEGTQSCIFLRQRQQDRHRKPSSTTIPSGHIQPSGGICIEQEIHELLRSTQLNEKLDLFQEIHCLLRCPSWCPTHHNSRESWTPELRHDPSDKCQPLKAMGNHEGKSPFIHLWIEREAISSTDLYLRNVNIALSDLELDIDTEMLLGFQMFVKECLEALGFWGTRGIPLEVIFQWSFSPMNKNLIPPCLGRTVTLKRMSISKFSIVVWCTLLLDKVDFLSDFLKIALRILMVSTTLDLVGAPIALESELVDHTLRGSLFTLLTVMKARYIQQVVRSLGAVLGYSSLANIPRAPLDLFRGTVGLGLTVAGSVSLGLGTVLSNLTFDSDYISRREKAYSNTPNTLKDGFVSATRELKEGFLSLGEVVRKPVGGAQRDGFSGFIRGLGKGVAGTIFKPVDKLSHAISNVASGIHAEYIVRDHHRERKNSGEKRRKPRLLLGSVGLIRKYDPYEADLRECLTLKKAKDILRSITIASRQTDAFPEFLLLIYSKKISLMHLPYHQRKEATTKKYEEPSDLSPFIGLHNIKPCLTMPAKSAQIMWTINCSEITSVRASSHGVIVTSPNSAYQIPCKDGITLINLYKEVFTSQQRAKPALLTENIVEWIGMPHST